MPFRLTSQTCVGTFARLSLLCGLMVVGGSGCKSLGGSQTALIEQMVDKQEVAALLDPRVHLNSEFTKENGVQVFVAEYPFKRHDPAQHDFISVQVAPAGHFLNPVEYEARRASFKAQGVELPGDFPDIGMRAQSDVFGVGPGGASYGITFTTRDGLYDVRVMKSNLLPGDVSVPQISLEALARRIEARYNSKDKRPRGP